MQGRPVSRLAGLEQAAPLQRYEHDVCDNPLQIDINKLVRIERPGRRITGDRRDRMRASSRASLFVAVDDHARVGFTDMYPHDTQASAVQFRHNAYA